MIETLLVLFALVASTLMVRSQRKAVRASWKRLAAAVPDTKALTGAPYRDGTEDALAPHSRKALDLLPQHRTLMRVQEVVAAAVAPAIAAAYALAPMVGLGAWSALLGAFWGLGTGAALLRDDRKALGLMGLLLVPIGLVMSASFTWHTFPFWAVVASVVAYGASRRVLDLKDSAGNEEAYRERMADPRYLVGSTEGRAAGIARGRSGGDSDEAGASARDNMSAT